MHDTLYIIFFSCVTAYYIRIVTSIAYSLLIAVMVFHRGAFSAVLGSMESIGFSSADVEQILTLLAAVLHIGDIVWKFS